MGSTDAIKTHRQIRVNNQTREQVLVTTGRAADNMWTRLRGLIGSKPLADGEGLLIVPCSSVHTHFMSFPIDVVYVDRDQKVVAIDQEMAPWRFGRMRKGVRFVIELPPGTAAATGTVAGDQLQVEGHDL
ncbi:DUF192 domain-containing protein [Chloroflexota bacterium]